jgi:hypothetical protein
MNVIVKKTGKYCVHSLTNIDELPELKLQSCLSIDYFKKNISTIKILYNIFQSDTQSRRCCSGKIFENIIDKYIEKLGINYSKQVYVNNNGIVMKKPKGKNTGHTIDFTIPNIKMNTNIKDFYGDIISVKTTLRERYNQDKQYATHSSRLVYISLEKIENLDKNTISIKIDKDTKDFTNYLIEIYHKFKTI